jgi:hypothetical protein
MYARKAGPNRSASTMRGQLTDVLEFARAPNRWRCCRARHNTSYKVGWRDKATAASGVDDDCARHDPHNRVATETPLLRDLPAPRSST